LPLKKFQHFLRSYQKEELSKEQCLKLIHKYEQDPECKKRLEFSFQGFVSYLTHDDQHINNKEREQVYFFLFSHLLNKNN
jgi:hypothetical protein